jgi:hypothetical protein
MHGMLPIWHREIIIQFPGVTALPVRWTQGRAPAQTTEKGSVLGWLGDFTQNGESFVHEWMPPLLKR